ncbi:hypothetical protein KI387_007158, partial [Taxus chinensis]
AYIVVGEGLPRDYDVREHVLERRNGLGAWIRPSQSPSPPTHTKLLTTSSTTWHPCSLIISITEAATKSPPAVGWQTPT